jgi:hypothetical protein
MKTSAKISLYSAAAYLVLLVALHVLKPELDPSWHFVSEYSIGQFGWVNILAFLTLSLSCFAAFVAVRPQITTIGGKIGLALLLLAAVALAAGGIFVMDPITATENEMTTHGKLHGLAGMIGIPSLPIAAVLLSRRRPRWVRWTAHSTWILLVLMDVVLFSTLGKNGGKFGPEVPIGWPNRLLVAAFAAWLIAISVHAAKSARKEPAVA